MPRIITVQETYRTSDLYLASYLYCSGFRLLDLQREGKRGYFCFEAEAGAAGRDFQLGQDEPIQASAYSEAVRKMKGLVMQGL